MRGLLSILGAFVLAAGAAACGEKDESAATAPSASGNGSASGAGSGGGSTQTQGDDPESQINNAVIEVVGGNDPRAVCEQLATPVYVKHAYGDVSGCRAAVAKRKRIDVAVTLEDIGGRTATATARPNGGPNDGERLTVDLVRQGEAWRVDVVRSNAPVGP